MNAPTHALRIERLFDAPREAVFRAWSEHDQLAEWYHFNEEWKIEVVDIDFRVGGRYRIGWKAPDGKMWYELGEYREIRPPQRIVKTCLFEFPDFEENETLITLEFHERGKQTLLVLLHEGYRTAEHRDQHQQGWPGFLDQLEKLLAAGSRA
jgi:uncharacterized protein YndB with AHSA1/START domain